MSYTTTSNNDNDNDAGIDIDIDITSGAHNEREAPTMGASLLVLLVERRTNAQCIERDELPIIDPPGVWRGFAKWIQQAA